LRLSGCITALATPFTHTGEVDLEAWERLIVAQLDAGIQGLVVAGSTGEAAALRRNEFDAIMRSAITLVAGRVPILAGTGRLATASTIEQTQHAAALGADAALVVVPPYVRPTQAGMVAHFRAVADDGGLPVVLYNVPGRTGSDLLPASAVELVGHERIVGIKEAYAGTERIQAWLALRAPSFAVLSGDDASACDALCAGADAVVSVAANVAPDALRRLCDLALAGATQQARRWDTRLRPLYEFLSLESNPIPLKALLASLGIGHGLRLPLTNLSPEHCARIVPLQDQLLTLAHSASGEERAVKERAVEERAVKERAVEERAVKERAVEKRAVELGSNARRSIV